MHTALVTKASSPAAAIIAFGLPAPLTQPDRAPLASGATRSFVKDEEIFAEGGRAVYLYKALSGTVRTSRLMSDGRRQIDSFHFAGDLFGIEEGDEYRFCAEAVEDCVVIAYRRSGLEALAGQDPRFAQQFASGMMRTLVRAQNHLLLLGRKTAMEKIASFLVELAERKSENCDTIDLPMSRIDIADHLGLTIETVSRSLTQLERQDIIGLPAARRIVLNNKSALHRLSA